METRTIQTRRVLIAAGRRVDAYGDVARFPSARVPAVQQQIQEFLAREKPLAVVCSAACGADLLILEAAGEQHIDRLIVLPSQPEQFRKMSVTDRPGNWGDVFDRVIRPSKVEVLSVPDGQQGYLQTNLKLVERGQAVAREHSAALQALVVWDKKERGPGDATVVNVLHGRQPIGTKAPPLAAKRWRSTVRLLLSQEFHGCESSRIAFVAASLPGNRFATSW